MTECVDSAPVGESASAPPRVRPHLEKCKALGMTVHGFLTPVSSGSSPVGGDPGSVRCVSIHSGSRRAGVPAGKVLMPSPLLKEPCMAELKRSLAPPGQTAAPLEVQQSVFPGHRPQAHCTF